MCKAWVLERGWHPGVNQVTHAHVQQEVVSLAQTPTGTHYRETGGPWSLITCKHKYKHTHPNTPHIITQPCTCTFVHASVRTCTQLHLDTFINNLLVRINLMMTRKAGCNVHNFPTRLTRANLIYKSSVAHWPKSHAHKHAFVQVPRNKHT